MAASSSGPSRKRQPSTPSKLSLQEGMEKLRDFLRSLSNDSQVEPYRKAVEILKEKLESLDPSKQQTSSSSQPPVSQLQTRAFVEELLSSLINVFNAIPQKTEDDIPVSSSIPPSAYQVVDPLMSEVLQQVDENDMRIRNIRRSIDDAFFNFANGVASQVVEKNVTSIPYISYEQLRTDYLEFSNASDKLKEIANTVVKYKKDIASNSMYTLFHFLNNLSSPYESILNILIAVFSYPNASAYHRSFVKLILNLRELFNYKNYDASKIYQELLGTLKSFRERDTRDMRAITDFFISFLTTFIEEENNPYYSEIYWFDEMMKMENKEWLFTLVEKATTDPVRMPLETIQKALLNYSGFKWRLSEILDVYKKNYKEMGAIAKMSRYDLKPDIEQIKVMINKLQLLTTQSHTQPTVDLSQLNQSVTDYIDKSNELNELISNQKKATELLKQRAAEIKSEEERLEEKRNAVKSLGDIITNLVKITSNQLTKSTRYSQDEYIDYETDIVNQIQQFENPESLTDLLARINETRENLLNQKVGFFNSITDLKNTFDNARNVLILTGTLYIKILSTMTPENYINNFRGFLVNYPDQKLIVQINFYLAEFTSATSRKHNEEYWFSTFMEILYPNKPSNIQSILNIVRLYVQQKSDAYNKILLYRDSIIARQVASIETVRKNLDDINLTSQKFTQIFDTVNGIMKRLETLETDRTTGIESEQNNYKLILAGVSNIKNMMSGKDDVSGVFKVITDKLVDIEDVCKSTSGLAANLSVVTDKVKELEQIAQGITRNEGENMEAILSKIRELETARVSTFKTLINSTRIDIGAACSDDEYIDFQKDILSQIEKFRKPPELLGLLDNITSIESEMISQHTSLPMVAKMVNLSNKIEFLKSVSETAKLIGKSKGKTFNFLDNITAFTMQNDFDLVFEENPTNPLLLQLKLYLNEFSSPAAFKHNEEYWFQTFLNILIPPPPSSSSSSSSTNPTILLIYNAEQNAVKKYVAEKRRIYDKIIEFRDKIIAEQVISVQDTRENLITSKTTTEELTRILAEMRLERQTVSTTLNQLQGESAKIGRTALSNLNDQIAAAQKKLSELVEAEKEAKISVRTLQRTFRGRVADYVNLRVQETRNPKLIDLLNNLDKTPVEDIIQILAAIKQEEDKKGNYVEVVERGLRDLKERKEELEKNAVVAGMQSMTTSFNTLEREMQEKLQAAQQSVDQTLKSVVEAVNVRAESYEKLSIGKYAEELQKLLNGVGVLTSELKMDEKHPINVLLKDIQEKVNQMQFKPTDIVAATTKSYESIVNPALVKLQESIQTMNQNGELNRNALKKMLNNYKVAQKEELVAAVRDIINSDTSVGDLVAGGEEVMRSSMETLRTNLETSTQQLTQTLLANVTSQSETVYTALKDNLIKNIEEKMNELKRSEGEKRLVLNEATIKELSSKAVGPIVAKLNQKIDALTTLKQIDMQSITSVFSQLQQQGYANLLSTVTSRMNSTDSILRELLATNSALRSNQNQTADDMKELKENIRKIKRYYKGAEKLHAHPQQNKRLQHIASKSAYIIGERDTSVRSQHVKEIKETAQDYRNVFEMHRQKLESYVHRAPSSTKQPVLKAQRTKMDYPSTKLAMSSSFSSFDPSGDIEDDPTYEETSGFYDEDDIPIMGKQPTLIQPQQHSRELPPPPPPPKESEEIPIVLPLGQWKRNLSQVVSILEGGDPFGVLDEVESHILRDDVAMKELMEEFKNFTQDVEGLSGKPRGTFCDQDINFVEKYAREILKASSTHVPYIQIKDLLRPDKKEELIAHARSVVELIIKRKQQVGTSSLSQFVNTEITPVLSHTVDKYIFELPFKSSYSWIDPSKEVESIAKGIVENMTVGYVSGEHMKFPTSVGVQRHIESREQIGANKDVLDILRPLVDQTFFSAFITSLQHIDYDIRRDETMMLLKQRLESTVFKQLTSLSYNHAITLANRFGSAIIQRQAAERLGAYIDVARRHFSTYGGPIVTRGEAPETSSSIVFASRRRGMFR